MEELRKEIKTLSDPARALGSQRYFKTGKGQYGEGDIFVGLTVPQCRILAKKYRDLDFLSLKKLLSSKIHEERLIALQILVLQFKNNRMEVFDFYLQNTKYINNWDLVDLSSRDIVGAYLFDKDSETLYKLARSSNLWERRIAIVATYYFIQQGQFENTLKISKILLSDKHDLMHKAVGWMLREVGKRDEAVLKKFLYENYKDLPRTTLRYAIERFPEEIRLKYLHGELN